MKINACFIAIAGAAAVVSTLLTATPASANAAACIAFLSSISESNLARDLLCDAAQTTGSTVSPEIAVAECTAAMELTALPALQVVTACEAAVVE